jgi:RNA polymerase sigma-70 factor (ECF subfamily)
MTDLYGIKQGSNNVFREVYHQYQHKLYAFVYQKTGSHYLAEEVVQQAFIRLWEKRTMLSDQVHLSTQLFQIAKTILVDELRKEAVKRTHISGWASSHVQVTENKQLELREHLEYMMRAINAMPPMRKTVFNMRRQQGLSYKEIATELDISPKTVENHIARAIKQLREAVLVLTL